LELIVITLNKENKQMSIVSYIDEGGWRTKMTAFSWLVSMMITPLAVISALLGEAAIPLAFTIIAAAALAFPLLFIPLWPLVIKPTWKYVCWPLLKGGAVFTNWLMKALGLNMEEIFDSSSKGSFKRSMSFGEVLTLGVCSSVIFTYYVGSLIAVLAITGVISVYVATLVSFGLVFGSFVLAFLMYLDSTSAKT
jgi:hypothetical protein